MQGEDSLSGFEFIEDSYCLSGRDFYYIFYQQILSKPVQLPYKFIIRI